jgi:SRSO17 transposase
LARRHHASLSIAAYGFLMAQRLKVGSDAGGKKNFVEPVHVRLRL